MTTVTDLSIIHDYDALCMVLLYHFLFTVGHGGLLALSFSCCWPAVGRANDRVDVCLFCGRAVT